MGHRVSNEMIFHNNRDVLHFVTFVSFCSKILLSPIRGPQVIRD